AVRASTTANPTTCRVFFNLNHLISASAFGRLLFLPVSWVSSFGSHALGFPRSPRPKPNSYDGSANRSLAIAPGSSVPVTLRTCSDLVQPEPSGRLERCRRPSRARSAVALRSSRLDSNHLPALAEQRHERWYRFSHSCPAHPRTSSARQD